MLVTQSEKKLGTWSWLLHVIGLLITVAGFAMLQLMVLQPIDRHHANVARQAESLSRVLDKEESGTAENRKLREALSEADDKIKRLLDRIPNVAREADFLGQITKLARDVGLEIVDYRPGKTVVRDEYQEMSVSLSSEGTYAGICNFLYRLHQLPRLSRASRLEISPRNDDGETFAMEMILNIYFAPESKLATASTGSNNG